MRRMALFLSLVLLTIITGHSVHASASIYQSSLGFQIEIPSGWTVLGQEEPIITVVEDVQPVRYGGVYVRKCPSPSPKECLVDGPTGELLKTSPANLGGKPAKEYTYKRWTAAKTRWWYEVMTIGTFNDETYAVIGFMPPFGWSRKYYDAYKQVRDSFQLSRTP